MRPSIPPAFAVLLLGVLASGSPAAAPAQPAATVVAAATPMGMAVPGVMSAPAAVPAALAPAVGLPTALSGRGAAGRDPGLDKAVRGDRADGGLPESPGLMLLAGAAAVVLLAIRRRPSSD